MNIAIATLFLTVVISICYLADHFFEDRSVDKKKIFQKMAGLSLLIYATLYMYQKNKMETRAEGISESFMTGPAPF